MPSSTAPRCRSMTGYASLQHVTGPFRIAIELRSVNSRFLDLIFRIPDELRAIESALRETISSRIARGKVECRIGLQRIDLAATGEPDGAMLVRLASWQSRVLGNLPDAAPLSVADALRWPGVMSEAAIDIDALREGVLTAAKACLNDFDASRQREGERLALALIERCEKLAEITAALKPRLPQLREAYRERISAKLAEAIGLGIPEGTAGMSREEIAARLSNEVAIFALRADIDEELTRLETHIAEVSRVVTSGANGGIGKRLDFLMQELHREANTLGSKAVASELADASIELKLLIEQMREQVQNIE
ncbi:MAG TPA: YicC/YloC family endoribonuclease [Burkholderiaceae bacterium]|nr:YicC/YloC family endoribonuclease [Burkholderiaceae bacterium]